MPSWRSSKKTLITVLAIAMSLFHLYTGVFGVLRRADPVGRPSQLRDGADPAAAGRRRRSFAGAAGRALAIGYDAVVAARPPRRWYRFAILDYLTAGRFEFVTPATPLEIALGVAFVFAVLELCRRETGWPLVVIIVVALISPYHSPACPACSPMRATRSASRSTRSI